MKSCFENFVIIKFGVEWNVVRAIFASNNNINFICLHRK